MLKAGNTAIGSVYVGDTKIQKAYLGNYLVYNRNRISRLPEGYTEVKYIQSGSGQFLNTGVSSSAVYRVEMDVEPLTTSSGCFFGMSAKVGTSRRVISCEKNGTASVIFKLPVTSGSGQYTISKNTSNRRIKITADYKNREFTIDGTTLKFTENWYQTGYNLYLLYAPASNSGASAIAALNAKLYSCKLYDTNDELLRDFVPCINPSGIPGVITLTDTGTQSPFYYYKSGTTTFIAGPAV